MCEAGLNIKRVCYVCRVWVSTSLAVEDVLSFYLFFSDSWRLTTISPDVSEDVVDGKALLPKSL